jgi:hypothetical protein
VLLQRWRRFDSVRERLVNRERAPLDRAARATRQRE